MLVYARKFVRAAGIEPASNAWEAFILPLNYARFNVRKSFLPKLIPRFKNLPPKVITSHVTTQTNSRNAAFVSVRTLFGAVRPNRR